MTILWIDQYRRKLKENQSRGYFKEKSQGIKLLGQKVWICLRLQHKFQDGCKYLQMLNSAWAPIQSKTITNWVQTLFCYWNLLYKLINYTKRHLRIMYVGHLNLSNHLTSISAGQEIGLLACMQSSLLTVELRFPYYWTIHITYLVPDRHNFILNGATKIFKYYSHL